MNDNDFFPPKIGCGSFWKWEEKVPYVSTNFLYLEIKWKKKTPQTFPKFLNRKFPIGI